METNLFNEMKFEVKKFEFKNLSSSESQDGIDKYHVKELSEYKKRIKEKSFSIIKKDRSYALKNQFSILPIVEHHRGLKEQKEEEREDKIKKVIAKRVSQYKKQAYEEGMKKGKQEGLDFIKKENHEAAKLRIEEFIEYIEAMRIEYGKTFETQKSKIYELIKTLTKWVILRELRDDGEYLQRLMGKLFVELDSETNFLIKVNKKSVDKIPGILKMFEHKLEGIENTRIEIIHDEQEFSNKGMILESENRILDATIKTQFKNLDKLFNELNDHENL